MCEQIQRRELKAVDNEEIRWAGEGVDDHLAWKRVKEALNKIRSRQQGKKMVLVSYDREDLQ